MFDDTRSHEFMIVTVNYDLVYYVQREIKTLPSINIQDLHFVIGMS